MNEQEMLRRLFYCLKGQYPYYSHVVPFLDRLSESRTLGELGQMTQEELETARANLELAKKNLPEPEKLGGGLRYYYDQVEAAEPLAVFLASFVANAHLGLRLAFAVAGRDRAIWYKNQDRLGGGLSSYYISQKDAEIAALRNMTPEEAAAMTPFRGFRLDDY